MTIPNQYKVGLVQIRPQVTDVTNRVHENVTWWLGSAVGPYTSSQLTAIGTAFGNVWATMWSHFGANDANYTNALVTDWGSSAGLTVSVAQPTAGLMAAPLGANTAILFSLKTGQRYKGGHGRVYLPSRTASDSIDGVNVPAATQTYYNGELQGLITAMTGVSTANGGPMNWVVYNQRRRVPNTPPTPPQYQPAFTSPVISVVVSNMLATQRRRLRKAPHH